MRKQQKASRLASLFWGGLYCAVLVIALGAGTLFGWAGRSSLLTKILKDPMAFLNGNPSDTFHQDTVNLLVLGCDEDRFYHGTYANGKNIYHTDARSDMMLLARLDFANNQITALSIPRDTMASLPGKGRHRINAFHEMAWAYHWGDPNQVTEEAVQHLLPGVRIDRVLELNFEAFQKLVDLVGGVDLTVPKAMNYDDNAGDLHIHLQPGYQHLDGVQSMDFVRFRHDVESDIGRQQRQKDFLMAFKQSVFKNVTRLPEITTDGKAVLNSALDDDEILALAAFARKVPPDRIKMGMIPVLDGPGSALHVDKEKLPQTLDEFGFATEPSRHFSAHR